MVSISSSIQADPTNAIIRKQVHSVQFGYYTDHDVRVRSVVEVTSTLAFDPVTHTPLPNGLYDVKMGPIPGHTSSSSSLASSSCITCGRLVKDCIGHCGHIELCVPVYHPMLLSNLLTLCQCICRNCFRFRLPHRQVKVIQMKFYLLNTEQYDQYFQFDSILASAIYQARNQNDSEAVPNKVASSRAAGLAVDQVLRRMEKDCNHALLSVNRSDLSAAPKKSTYYTKLYNELCTETMKQLQVNTIRCAHCGAYSPKLRLDTSNKIFQCTMSKKYAQCNRMEGIVSFPSAIQFTLKKKVSDSAMDDFDDTERFMNDSETGNDDDNNDEGTESSVSTSSKKQKDMYLPPTELQAMVNHIYSMESKVCQLLFGNSEKYFLQCVAVLPNRFRPPMKVNTMMVEHVQTVTLMKVLQTNASIRDQMATLLHSQSADTNTVMTPLSNSSSTNSTIYQSWIELQTAVNIYMDSSKDPSVSGAANTSSAGIRQILERKEGLFRKHMMGKRVNYACRSVISPDPYIGSNEIGIPKYFCSILTYPTPVTQFNISELRVAVERGPNQYPGARWVIVPSFNGGAERVIDLSKMNLFQRRAISAQLLKVHKSNPKPHVVGRQLRDGDYVLMNRQPTLHKPGIMAHRVRVLHSPSQKTIRMHYANCNTYNADFDGDEMNCHFPQNDIARVEAKYLAQTDLQYIVPTDGSPLRGLIQDHVVGGVKMTSKDSFFKKWEFQQLLFAALSSLPGLEVIRQDDKIELLPPAILKPCELWTGKQVITAVLCHLRKGSDRDSVKLSNFSGLSMERQSKTSDTSFGAEQQEHLVLIRDGELLRGVLDKNAFGATSFSLVHCVYEAYGPEKAGLLLNIFGRLFTAYLQYYSGHSCRMEDLMLTNVADSERRSLIQRAYNVGARAAKAWADSEGGKVSIPPIADQADALLPFEEASTSAKIGMLLAGSEGKENFAALDGFMQGQLNPLASNIVKKTLPIGLAVPFPRNTFGIMTTTGAKGSIVNQSQVSCALGQQALEGRRVPRMSSGRTLPSFAAYDPNPRADGFVMDRFLTGIRPQEYYFHCMAGREGLVDTAVKTSRSGYLQRCLIKHLEELKIAYDFSVRNAEGNVIQFLYGEDGLDPTKASYLDCSLKSFEFMARNHDSLKRHNIALPSSSIDIAAKDAFRYNYLKTRNLHSDCERLSKGDFVLARRLRHGQAWVRGAMCSGWSFATVTKVHSKGKIIDLKYHSDGHIAKHVPMEADLGGAGGKETMALTSKAIIVRPCALDPILSSTREHLVGSSGACVSEHVAESAFEAMSTNSKLSQVLSDLALSKQYLSTLICAKYSSSICSPGEAVGSIAAQSVGEPSTQMTLNTFHLAGAGANVTLGIPRLREIIMTASRSLKTPTMSVPLLNSVSEKDSIRLALGFKKLSLMDLIAGKCGISVTERLGKNESGGWLRAYYVTIKFHPAERIKEAFGLSLQDIALVVAKNFVPLLSQIMKKELKRSAIEDDEKLGEVVGGSSSEFLEDGLEDHLQAPQVFVEHDDLNEADDDDLDDVAGEEDGVEFKQNENSSYDGDIVEMTDDDDDVNLDGHTQSLSWLPDQTDLSETRTLDREAPTILKRCNSIALQGLKVEPSARPLLMVGLVEKAASAILVRSRKNIEEAFINEEPGRGKCLQTSGINFEEIWKLDSVKHNELSSNDIWAVRCHYGVEAARGSIVSQVRSVFGAYGIEVDPRHLSLIADYMTYDGGFKPMSRIGMEDSSSTLLQMSFETTAHFLKKAAMFNSVDDIASPSANIVLGLPIQHGTGCFSLLARS